MAISGIVLVVEDELLIQQLLEVALAEAGYEIAIVSSGLEAVAFLNGCSEWPRALITDINLGPPPSGWDLGRHARDLCPWMPVVYMSGESGHEWASEGVTGSCMVPKPFAPAQIVAALCSLMVESVRPTGIGALSNGL